MGMMPILIQYPRPKRKLWRLAIYISCVALGLYLIEGGY